MSRFVGFRMLLIPALATGTACQFVPGTDAKAIADAKNEIAQELIDPSSAQFRKVVVGVDEPLTICGEINGKNRMGAYAGFKRFIVAPSVNMHQIAYDAKLASPGQDEEETALADNQRWFDMSWKSGCESAVAATD